MTGMSKLDSVWETHDFVIKHLTENESEYNHLLGQMQIYLDMYEKGVIKKQDLLDFIEKSEKICKSLLSLYNKHLLTIKEINIMIEEKDVPPEREVTAECVDELQETTLNLIQAVKDSERLFDFLREEHKL